MNPIIETIELLKLASGDCLSLQIYKFIGKQPGKKVYIQANLHGAEIVGNAVIHQLIEFLTSLDSDRLKGEIWLVPVCNPLSINQRNHFFSTGRFNSYDGKDWNRIFWDYEKECEDLEEFAKANLNESIAEIREKYLTKIKQKFQEQLVKIQKPSGAPFERQYRYYLQSLCLDVNYVIDIHSSSNQSIDYLYCFSTRQESASLFLLEYGVLMHEYEGKTFDEAFMKPWLALEKQLAKLGRNIEFDLESWTLELGSGMKINPESVEKGFLGIKNYLLHKNIIDLPSESDRSWLKIKLVEKNNIQDYYAPTGGMIRSRVELGSRVLAGEKLYQILSFNKTSKLPDAIDIVAESNGFVFDVSTNYSVNQGEYVLGMMRED
jgi:predicted deacylase